MLDTFPIKLEHPAWMIVALAPVISWFLKTNIFSHNSLERFADTQLWHWLIRHPAKQSSNTLPVLLPIAWFCAAVALSNPVVSLDAKDTQETRHANLAIVIDISPSMSATDLQPTRLSRVKLELDDFIKRLEGDRTALIIFSSNAYQILPLTHDHDTLKQFIDALDTNLTRRRGTNLTQALELASQTLENSGQRSRAIILISDGEEHETEAAYASASRLANADIPIISIGVGTQTGAAIQNAQGNLLHHEGHIVVSKLQSGFLKQLASITGGIYTTLTPDDRDWDTVFNRLDQLVKTTSEMEIDTTDETTIFPWFLGVCIALFLYSGLARQAALAAVIMFPLVFSSEPASAGTPWQENQAYQALKEKEYQKAQSLYQSIDTFNGLIGRGVSAYRLQKWQTAGEAFERAYSVAKTDAERAKASYNLGNTLAGMGLYKQAIRSYNEALKLQPHHKQASYNLDIVTEQILKLASKDKAPIKHQRSKVPINTSEDNIDNKGYDDDRSDETSREASTQRTSKIKKLFTQWQLDASDKSETALIAQIQLGSVNEDIKNVLRHRMAIQEGKNLLIKSDRPW
ncbi:MAG: VWA domain-containing protein [Gammaproteobacteria bacterium]